MSRDDYASMKARQDVVTAFINKLEKAEMNDINLIPALLDYVNTGDRSLFNEYNKFRNLFYAKKKAKDMEEQLAKAKANAESLEAELEETERQIEEYRNNIRDVFLKYREWVKEMRNVEIIDAPQAEYPNMKALRDFAQTCIDSSPNGYNRKLWIKEGNKMRTVTAILFDGKKAVIEISDPTTITIPVRCYT